MSNPTTGESATLEANRDAMRKVLQQMKAATGEWTVQTLINLIGWNPNGRDFKKLSDAHNAELAAEREHHQEIVDSIDDVIGEANQEIQKLREQLDIALEALSKIACWSEGEKVTGSFDEPASVEEARAALANIRGKQQ